MLIEVGASKFYNPESDQAWNMLKQLFAAMREGSPFGADRINKFNGGLFAKDPGMDILKIPNRVFCEQNQGQSTQRLLRYPKTLLYFSAKYNFGTASDAGWQYADLKHQMPDNPIINESIALYKQEVGMALQ